MECQKYHTSVVPCLVNIIENEIPKNFKETYYKNPNAIFRYGPDGLVMYAGLFTCCSGDKEFANIMKRREIKSNDIDPKFLNLLIKKNILVENYSGNPVVKNYNAVLDAYDVTFEITSRCNSNCVHCYFGGPNTKAHEPSLNEIKNRISKLESMGILSLELSGGEPTLRNDLTDIVDEIKNNNMTYKIATNGSMLEKLDKRILLNSSGIFVSLDGRKEIHDKIRRYLGLHDKVMNGLNLLEQLGVRRIISSTIWDDNISEIDYILEVAKKYNAEVFFGNVVSTSKAKNNNLKSSNNVFSFDKKSVKVWMDLLKYPKIIDKCASHYGCDMGKQSFTLTTDGRVLPCLFDRYLSVGYLDNLDVGSLTKKFRIIKSNLQKKLKNCQSCKDISICSGPCKFSRTYQKWCSE